MSTRTTTVRLYQRHPLTITTEATPKQVDKKHTRAVFNALVAEGQAEASTLAEDGAVPQAVQAVRTRKWTASRSSFDPGPAQLLPKPSNRAFGPGSWVTWDDPETGQPLLGVVSTSGHGTGVVNPFGDPRDRVIQPADGSDAMTMRPRPGCTATSGDWQGIYSSGISVRIIAITTEKAFAEIGA
ncbi:hypothetical protein [Streptomyces sp. NPDC001205]